MTETERILNGAKKGLSPEEIAESTEQHGRFGRKRPDSTFNPAPGDNTKYITHAMRLASLPKIEMSDPAQVEERCETYFRMAAEDDAKPSLAALSLALGIDRAYLYMLCNGVKRGNPDSVKVLKKARQILDTLMVDYMQNGKINPVSGIFIMKNTLGYRDQQEIVVSQGDPMQNGDPAEIRERYLDSVVAPALPEASSPFDAIEVEFVDEVAEGAESAE